MDIKIKVIEELADGGAICEVTYDAEGLEFLVQKGTVAAIKEGIEQEKKCLMNSTKNTPARWVKKMLKRLGTNLNQMIDSLLLKPLIYTSNIGNTPTPTEPTSHIPPVGSTLKGGQTKSSSKPPKKKKSPGLQLKNLQSKKAKKSA
jgi:hypothetical protein